MKTTRTRFLKRSFPVIFSLTLTSLCLFGAAGRLNWWNAWVLLALNLCASVTSIVLLGRDSELLAERRNARAGKSWDKLMVFIVVLLGPVATWVTAGLDARFHWSQEMDVRAVAAGIVVAVLGAALVAWAMRTNRFFSAVVRIQKDRGHRVVSSGPYRFVRHPGYTGMAAFTLVTPLILNSRCAFVPAAATAAAMVLRTVLEDRTLRKELDGYVEYARRVRYRLVPIVW